MPSSDVLPIVIRAVIPTNGGTALFLGNEEKVFLVFIDNSVGAAIAMHLGNVPPPRPQTHDLMAGVLTGLGAKLERAIINAVEGETFYARMIFSMENEVSEHKVVEVDARPSDSIALALRMEAPLYVSREVWDSVSDRSDELRKLEAQQNGEGEEESRE
ncbi:MAG: bifunctional nuclease family protein [Verrucomicrobiales bacterium]